MYKAVIFDMDGVIFDTEKYYIQATYECLIENGIDISMQSLCDENVFGSVLDDVWSKLKTKYSLPERVDFYTHLIKQKRNNLLYTEGLHTMPGCVELIKKIKKHNYCIGLASSSPLDDIKSNLITFNLFEYFDVITSGTNCKQSKPDPEIYLTTARKLNVDPEECIVFEDSTNGVISAKTAGMTCIGYANPNSVKQNISMADKIITSFDLVKVTANNILI